MNMQIAAVGSGCGSMGGTGTSSLLLLLQLPGPDPQLLLLALLLGAIDESSKVLTALATHDGMGPDDGRQNLLSASILHQLAGTVKHDVAGCQPVATVGLSQ